MEGQQPHRRWIRHNVHADAVVNFWPNRQRRKAKKAAERRAKKHLRHARKVSA